MAPTPSAAAAIRRRSSDVKYGCMAGDATFEATVMIAVDCVEIAVCDNV